MAGLAPNRRRMIKNLRRIPKRKVTVDELLGRDDAVKRLDEVSPLLLDAKSALVLILNPDDTWEWRTFGLSNAEAVYYLEYIKNEILNSEDE
jgi:hypothetical protein